MAKPIPFVGKCFPTADQFMDYLDTITFGAWRPAFVTMHHTGGPNLKQWQAYGTRKPPISDEQWMKNLASYYGKSKAEGGPADGPWRSGPQFFFTPKNFCVLSLPDRRGVHARSFNANSWGVECVGDFDSELFTEELAERYATGLACLHVVAGLSPGDFRLKVRGLHFHRDDPLTSKTCPGTKVSKHDMVSRIQKKMVGLSNLDDDDKPPHVQPAARHGVIAGLPADDPSLNVRAGAGGKYPVIRVLRNGDAVKIEGETVTSGTKWLDIGGGFVAARYVKIG
jgi:hypothetical protein